MCVRVIARVREREEFQETKASLRLMNRHWGADIHGDEKKC